MRAADADDVAVDQDPLALNARAIDLGAVGAPEVDQHEGRACRPHFRVSAADVGIVDRDGAAGKATHGDDFLAECDALAAGQHQRASANTAASAGAVISSLIR